MSWTFIKPMRRAREYERKLARRLNDAYARWHKKHRELPYRRRDREQERRLLGTRNQGRNDRPEEAERQTSEE